ncbi:MAG: HEAT repeat domain-containing protein [Okeania sp. SIO3B3]|nr:HEAT repeat domain-containing protein [Okeania sp. SIO3B3]
MFFDTYELIGQIDAEQAIREVIKKSDNQVIWVIAGRNDLTKSIWRNPVAQDALTSILEKTDEDPDIVALAIKSLSKLNALENLQLIHFLDLNKSPDRFVREAAANSINYKVEKLYNLNNISSLKKVVLEVGLPVIQAMRNDFMRDARDAATNTGASIFDAMNSLNLPDIEENVKVKEELAKINNKLELALFFRGKRGFNEAKLPSETEPETLIEYLQTSNDIYYKVGVIRKLGNLQAQKAINPLTDLLRNTNEEPDIRASAAESLGKIGTLVTNNEQATDTNNEQAIDTLIDTLIDALKYNEQKSWNDQFVRLEAAIALGKLIPPRAINKLYKAIREDKFSNVREAEKKALANYLMDSEIENWNEHQNNAFNYLVKTVTNPEKEKKDLFPNLVDIQDKLINDWSNQGQKNEFHGQSISQLIDALKQTENPDECVAIAKEISNLKDPSALQSILDKLEELKEGDWIARTAVVEVLGQLKISIEQLEKAQVIKILIERWRNDPISDVRDAVQKVIGNIYVEANGYEPAEDALKRYLNDKYILENLKAKIESSKTT